MLATGLSRRAVQEALREPAYDPPEDAARELDGAHVARWQARLPRPIATSTTSAPRADTAVRRARFLHDTYWLDGAHLICVGDRDLTSLAVATVSPGVQVTVVDVDERILAVIRAVAREEGLNVQTAFADLRLGPPASLRETGDLAFTDPPYTPEGIQLFAARALQMLKPEDAARVLIAYGYGEAQAALGYEVQEALHELRLLIEALYPQFNRYVGAEAIGSASSLYVTRPTRRTWAAAEKKGRSSARIYSGGKASLESSAAVAPGPDRWRPPRHAGARPHRSPGVGAARPAGGARATAHAARRGGPPGPVAAVRDQRRHLHAARGHAPARDRRSLEVQARQRLA